MFPFSDAMKGAIVNFDIVLNRDYSVLKSVLNPKKGKGIYRTVCYAHGNLQQHATVTSKSSAPKSQWVVVNGKSSSPICTTHAWMMIHA